MAAAQETETRPGVTASLRVKTSPTGSTYETAGTGLLDHKAVEHLLSSRPLRRPNRTRPLES